MRGLKFFAPVRPGRHYTIQINAKNKLNKEQLYGTLDLYIPNQLVETTTSYSDHFLVTLTNIDVDKISSATITLTLSDSITGTYYTST